MILGYAGSVLRVNLSSGETAAESLDEVELYNLIGGRGYGVWTLHKEVDPKIDPLSEKNKMVFMTGPLTGTHFPGSGRISVCSKSPLTGTVFDCSMGGSFGVYLKFAGFDGIILEGKSSDPVYLLIDRGRARLERASDLWGKTTSRTEAELKRKHPGSMVAEIGPAGEKLVRIACISSDTRVAGRGGLGAVMGSKGLKAIVVKAKLGSKVMVANKDAYKRLIKKIRYVIQTHPITGEEGSLALHGTAVLIHITANAGILPVENFSVERRWLAYEEVDPFSGETIKENYLVGRKGCYMCTTACGRRVRIGGVITKGPEFESIALLGPNSGFFNFEEEIFPLCALCDEMGMDTISAGNIVGFARRAGMVSTFEEARDLLVNIAHDRSPFSKGVKEAAKEMGMEDEAMQVKGLEMPAYNPVGAKGMALAYATSNRGACHLRAYTIAPEILNNPQYVDPSIEEDKAKLVRAMQDAYAIYDSLVICKFHGFALFTTLAYELDDLARLLSAITGWKFTNDLLHEIGDRIYTLERIYNLKAGISPEQDTLPRSLKIDLKTLLSEYYRERGWKNGIPRPYLRV